MCRDGDAAMLDQQVITFSSERRVVGQFEADVSPLFQSKLKTGCRSYFTVEIMGNPFEFRVGVSMVIPARRVSWNWSDKTCISLGCGMNANAFVGVSFCCVQAILPMNRVAAERIDKNVFIKKYVTVIVSLSV